MQRISILTIGILAFAQTVFAQSATWDSTYRPNMYQTRVGQFRSFADAPTDIIFLGNSITAYANWDELLGDQDAKNRGIPGDITFGVIERLDEVTKGRPAKVFILIGINDVARNVPDSVIVKNYERIIRGIKSASPATRIYFHTLLPVNNTFTPSLAHFNKDAHIVNVNQQLKGLAAREGIYLIDLYSAFLDAEKKLNRKYSFDGLHLNDQGYLKWAEILQNGKYLLK